MNMLEGNIVEKEKTFIIDLGVSSFELPVWMGEKMKEAKGSHVMLGFRPEHITLAKKYQKNAIEAKIDMLELVGKELYVHLTAGDNPIVATTKPSEALKIYEKVWVTLDEEKIHIFDGKTEEALI
jgi:multiple sugar transport system ATP-binding protein